MAGADYKRGCASDELIYVVIVGTRRRMAVFNININKLFLYEEYLNTVVIRGYLPAGKVNKL